MPFTNPNYTREHDIIPDTTIHSCLSFPFAATLPPACRPKGMHYVIKKLQAALKSWLFLGPWENCIRNSASYVVWRSTEKDSDL